MLETHFGSQGMMQSQFTDHVKGEGGWRKGGGGEEEGRKEETRMRQGSERRGGKRRKSCERKDGEEMGSFRRERHERRKRPVK